eukprot:NODE_1262_length_1211_cov_92.808950_g1033_i0.p2 GENE.NODE_1262_length_1211_cov_92.808950_g1033_i0~~NODE_1262_length_1211_cov_92.808950_g1033_i0.p2  ORF type:complete len:143 (-),score=23.01 NODE_1262_length_1211_cov_92.808950_g1033_i0:65-493(-)
MAALAACSKSEGKHAACLLSPTSRRASSCPPRSPLPELKEDSSRSLTPSALDASQIPEMYLPLPSSPSCGVTNVILEMEFDEVATENAKSPLSSANSESCEWEMHATLSSEYLLPSVVSKADDMSDVRPDQDEPHAKPDENK